MEDKIILTLEEVASWSYNNIVKQRKQIKRLSFAVFCLSVAGIFTAREIRRLSQEIEQLKPQTEDKPASE
jgi:hypothetical protein